MATITEQFIDAIKEWTLKTGESEKNLIAAMFDMAAFQRIETDPTNESSLTLTGTQNLIAQLINKSGFTETFCVMAFVRAIEDRFRVAYELYNDKQNEAEQEPNRLREIARDPEKFNDFKDRIESVQQKEMARGVKPAAEGFATPEELIEFADECESYFKKGIEEDASEYLAAVARLKTWQEVIAPIVEATNLDTAKRHDDWKRLRA